MKILYNYILLFILILLFMYILYNSYKNNEAFTPYIREIYRPQLRNARIYSEGFYNNHKNNIDSFLRRFGIK